MLYVQRQELENIGGLSLVEKIDSVEDVATILEVFSELKKEIDYKRIENLYKDDDGYFIFSIVDDCTSFDLFSLIRDSFDDIIISSVNVKYLFPKRLSRGIKPDIDIDEEDIATSYLDEESLGFPNSDKVYSVYYAKTGDTFTISKKGVIIGRSSKCDYTIEGNTSISRNHCNIFVNDNGSLVIHDFNSYNGTFVNNNKITSDTILYEGDTFYLADEEFRVL